MQRRERKYSKEVNGYSQRIRGRYLFFKTILQKSQEALNRQIKHSQQQEKTIQELQRKIDSFNQNQKELIEKSRFKAGSYLQEINQRDEELARIRSQFLANQDELKVLTVSREQQRQQTDNYRLQLSEREKECEQLRKKLIDMNNVMEKMCISYKSGGDEQNMENIRENIERAERIAKSTNKSSFMGLGEKQPTLYSEKINSQDQIFKVQSEESYLNDDSIPSEIYSLIQKYRDKIIQLRGSQQMSLIINDFFSQAHSLIKDTHMREIARIRNEHSVEIMKLRKNLQSQLCQFGEKQPKRDLRSKENFIAGKVNDKFIENEVERQRRALVEENEVLKKRLRALETLMNSGNQEKVKFIEGASWISKKAHVETEKHIQRLTNVLRELDIKQENCVIDISIYELNGREVLKTNQWLKDSINKCINDLGEKFESIFENVNVQLKDATRQFQKYN